MDDDGRCDGNLMVMDGTARWQWTTRQQLYGKGRRHGDSTAMDDKERHERNGDVGAASGGSDKGQRGIKT